MGLRQNSSALVFLREADGGFTPPCFPDDSGRDFSRLRLGTFVRTSANADIFDERWFNKYTLGFHFFPTREAARECKRDMKIWDRFRSPRELKDRKFVIVQCRFSDVRSKGTQTYPAGEDDIQKRAKTCVTYTAGSMILLKVVR
jgi:hypothetical protein